jgi:predicted DNA binding CopG/RHH family protein
MKKKLPKLRSDKEAEEFVANSDLTEYDLSGMRLVRFEFQPKSERVNMRLPRPLLDAVKATAAKAGVPYSASSGRRSKMPCNRARGRDGSPSL